MPFRTLCRRAPARSLGTSSGKHCESSLCMRSSHPVAAAVREDETNMSAELDFVDVEATRMRARRQLENAPASPARPAVSHCPPVSRLVQRSSVQASCLALGRPTSCSTRVVREWDDWSRARRPGQSTDAASTTSTRSLQRTREGMGGLDARIGFLGRIGGV